MPPNSCSPGVSAYPSPILYRVLFGSYKRTCTDHVSHYKSFCERHIVDSICFVGVECKCHARILIVSLNCHFPRFLRRRKLRASLGYVRALSAKSRTLIGDWKSLPLTPAVRRLIHFYTVQMYAQYLVDLYTFFLFKKLINDCKKLKTNHVQCMTHIKEGQECVYYVGICHHGLFGYMVPSRLA